MPTVDPKVEEPTRDMLGHAIRGELQDLSTLVHAIGNETYTKAVGLCLLAAAYIAVDVSGRWPTDSDVRQIAENTAGQETRLDLDADEIYDYLSKSALGFRPLPEALGSDAAAATLPVLITGSMLFTFRPKDQQWWDYLDQIWSAYESSDKLASSALPALQVVTRMRKEAEPG